MNFAVELAQAHTITLTGCGLKPIPYCRISDHVFFTELSRSSSKVTDWYTLGVYLKMPSEVLQYREKVVPRRTKALQDRAVQLVDEQVP